MFSQSAILRSLCSPVTRPPPNSASAALSLRTALYLQLHYNCGNCVLHSENLAIHKNTLVLGRSLCALLLRMITWMYLLSHAKPQLTHICLQHVPYSTNCYQTPKTHLLQPTQPFCTCRPHFKCKCLCL